MKSGGLCGAAMIVLAAPAMAQGGSVNHAVGVDLTFSSDAEDVEVVRTGLNLDWRYRTDDDYLGFRLEKNWFQAPGVTDKSDTRAYLRLARPLGEWKARATVGTDGKTLLGSASINDEKPLRKELFVERDKIETPMGFARPLYHTFAGAAVDIPLSERSQLTLLGGIQEFTGDNLRLHVRSNFIYVVKPEWGLSFQLRARHFQNSEPREYDYYSPASYLEVLPVVQMRRFSGGWRYLAAAGLGAQRDSGSDWRQSRYLNLRVTSPGNRQGWALNGELTYSNLPVTNVSEKYSYFRVFAGITRKF